jgi:exopolysaccharide production protein ExoZ
MERGLLSSSPNVALSGATDLPVRDRAKTCAPARNATIQYLRALAAASVLLHHASIADGRFAVYGVSLFFAISGYLMSDLVRSTDPWRFLSHRVVRIYPIFFLMVGFSFILSRILGSPFTFDALAVTLAPVGLRSYSLGGIEWTLVFEVTYYTALFLIACAKLQRHLELIAIGWIGVIVGSALLFPSLEGLYLPVHVLFLAPANLAFAGGLLLPSLISRGYLPRAGVLLVLPIALAYDFVDLGTNRMLSGVAAVLVVGWAAQRKAHAAPSADNGLLRLGDWSYALYLCHVPVIQAVVQLWPTRLQELNPAWFAAGAAFLLVLLFGPLDVALYRKLRSLADAAHPRTIRVTVSAFLAAFLALTVYGSASSILDEIQNRRIRSTLNQLGPTAMTSPDAASARIAATRLALPASFQGAFERIDALPDGRVIFRGWALSADDPSQEIKIRVFCGGREVEVERYQRKMRTDIARSLGREDVASRRIGFTAFASRRGCLEGAQAFVIAFDELGKAAVLPGVHDPESR